MKRISCFLLSLALCFQCMTPALAATESNDKSKGIMDSIGNALGNAWDWATGAAENAADKTTTVANDAQEKACNAANTAWDATTNAWSVTSHSLSNTWGDMFGEIEGSNSNYGHAGNIRNSMTGTAKGIQISALVFGIFEDNRSIRLLK